MKPLTKMARQIVSPRSIPTIVRDAFRVAQEERPGPVLLELPEDVAGARGGRRAAGAAASGRVAGRASRSASTRAAEMIQQAKRPLIMIGAAGNRPRLVEELSSFVQRTGIPFFNTQMGKGAVTGCSEHLHGHRRAFGRRLRASRSGPCRPDHLDRPRHDREAAVPDGPRRPAGDPYRLHVGERRGSVLPARARCIGDIGPSLTLLADRLEGKLKLDPAFLALREEILGRVTEGADDDRFPVMPQRLVADVRKVMPEDGIVCLDNGMYKIWFARNYRTQVANTLLLDNALATMGAGLPSAMMAAMLYPKRRVLAVCGDGGFMMNSQEMETAVRLKLNLVVVVLNDSAYGMIRWKQAVDKFADFGLTFGNPDFVKYAEAYGAKGSRVTASKDLVPTLDAAFKGGGVHLVDVPIDYSENVRVLVDELKQRVNEIELA